MITQISVVALTGFRTRMMVWTEEHVGFKSIEYAKYSTQTYHPDCFNYWLIDYKVYLR